MKFYSPLRYPGGKSKLIPLVSLLVSRANIKDCVYIEPFVGGGGIALSLLLENKVNQIVINDYDQAVYSFWRAVKENSKELIELVEKTPVTMEEWYKQKNIYSSERKYSVELAFATLFLNRTNRSGILIGGPMGGHAQDGKWKLDVRFNRKSIVSRINAIAKRKDSIVVYNQDIISFIDKYIPQYKDKAFVYFDPPYYDQGRKLYRSFLTPDHHALMAERVLGLTCPWIITYDDVPAIQKLYSNCEISKFDLNYSTATRKIASEIMISNNVDLRLSSQEIVDNDIRVNVRPQT